MDSLYMDMQNKNVLVVGSGEVGERRARRFLKSGANVVINSDHVSDQLKELELSINHVKNFQNGQIGQTWWWWPVEMHN